MIVRSLCFIAILLLAAKPCPVIITLVPGWRDLGSTVIAGTIRIVAGATLARSFSELAPMVCWPLMALGTMKLDENVPIVFGETLVLVNELSNVRVTDSLAGKPVPFKATVAPGETETGSTFRRGRTLNCVMNVELLGSSLPIRKRAIL